MFQETMGRRSEEKADLNIMELGADFLSGYGIQVNRVLRNAPPAVLYEEAVRGTDGDLIAENGCLLAFSGERTGRSPSDKRIVRNPESEKDVWWGDINIPLTDDSFVKNRQRAIDYLNRCEQLYVFDGFAGWSRRYRQKVRIICSRPYHALFMHNMLIRPSAEELAEFGEPDYVIYNAGAEEADPDVEGIGSTTSVSLSLERGEFVILGTEYAGEMKKGIFTVMNYLMPKEGVLSMHCSANEGADGDVALFFGLSGTGKTTLSHAPDRRLIGDDEHCWSDEGVFNIEGGCYAKCAGLAAEKEPEIWNALRFGALLENVTCDPETRKIDYDDTTLTENTRACYPVEFIQDVKIPCEGPTPKNILFLTCDAFGVLPPVSRLDSAQARYYFINGYTAKIPGTEQGIKEPQAVFSACFGAPFLVWHPMKYAEALAERAKIANANFWLVNTGWTGGPYGVGERIALEHTRAIVTAIHDGSLTQAEFRTDPIFGLSVPTTCPGVPDQLLNPEGCWSDPVAFRDQAQKLADRFEQNYSQYSQEGSHSDSIKSGP